MKKDNWILIIFIMTFILSVIFSTITNLVTTNVDNLFILILMLIIVIGVGVTFDLIGTASITAKEATFHSMSSSKVKGAKEALSFIKDSSKVSSICNDVIGDICGIVSGGLGTIIAIGLSVKLSLSSTLVSVLVAAFISSLTVGGKAIFKKVAVKKADNIIFFVGKVKSTFKL